MAKMRLDMRISPELHKQKDNGSALVLVVVVTVLLSVIGVIFVMTMRMREMTTSNITDNRDLDAAVHSTVGQIGTILVQDLFGTSLNKSIIDGTGGNEPYDSLGTNDRWLASLEPVLYDQRVVSDPTDDWYQWERITDLSGGAVASKWDLILRNGKKTSDDTGKDWDITKKEFGGIVEEYQEFDAILKQTPEYVRQHPDMAIGLPADADGDGVADSMWIKLPNLSTSKGKPVFAAVRIVDNCAMLNLNTAYCFYQKLYSESATSPFEKFWYINKTAYGYGMAYLGTAFSSTTPYGDGGRYLAEINYLPFLRGSDLSSWFTTAEGKNTTGDGWYKLLAAKKIGQADSADNWTLAVPLSSIGDYHQVVLMNIENAGKTYSLFDIGDELEIRNRFLLTSRVESRFERKDVANYTFDAGGGVYASLRIPRNNSDAPISAWKVRIDSKNFDLWDENGTLKTTASPDYPNIYKYDRRHVCTFYSFDRNIRTAQTTFYTFLDSQPEAVRYVFVPKNKMAITTNIKDMTASVPYNNKETRRKILHLLYAFREYFKNERGLTQNKAAIQAAQIVANMIDYADNDKPRDDNDPTTQGPFYYPKNTPDGFPYSYGSQRNPNPTYINKAIVDTMVAEVSGNVITPTWSFYSSVNFGLTASDVVYGYECQPFISELYTRVNDSGVVDRFAIELYNPYSQDINIENWKLVLEDQAGNFLTPSCPFSTSVKVPGKGYLVVRSDTSIKAIGTIVVSNGFGLSIRNAYKIRLIAKDPVVTGTGLVVDQIRRDQILLMTTDTLPADGKPTHHVLKRGDRSWRFCNASAFVHRSQILPPGAEPDVMLTLGKINDENPSVQSYSLPVANDSLPIERLADFGRVAFIGNQKITIISNQRVGADPNAITDSVGKASAGSRGEAEVRFDITSDGGLLNYICTLNRSQGNLPGRININTAPKYVIAAAIPPQLTDPNLAVNALTLAEQIVAYRPYTNLGDLLKVPMIKRYLWSSAPNVGDTGMDNDLEERDWILSRLSNIFTVRSDTFTAYILVRLGTDGPQRRMLAIFDRSNVWSSADKPKLVALHPVPDPR
jgi:hypothetical protein